MEFNIEFKDLNAYSSLSASKILSLFCFHSLTFEQVLRNIFKEVTFLLILTSPKGMEIDFFPIILILSYAFLFKVGISKLF